MIPEDNPYRPPGTELGARPRQNPPARGRRHVRGLAACTAWSAVYGFCCLLIINPSGGFYYLGDILVFLTVYLVISAVLYSLFSRPACGVT